MLEFNGIGKKDTGLLRVHVRQPESGKLLVVLSQFGKREVGRWGVKMHIDAGTRCFLGDKLMTTKPGSFKQMDWKSCASVTISFSCHEFILPSALATVKQSEGYSLMRIS